jgi:hypothetical protein
LCDNIKVFLDFERYKFYLLSKEKRKKLHIPIIAFL